jgi:carboxymethylenebutenolidase
MPRRSPSCTLALSLALLVPAGYALAQVGYAPYQNPVGLDAWWWDADWWEDGQLPVPANHAVTTRWIEYDSGDATVPALVARPADGERYPAVLYQHGRRGLDDLVQAQVRRIAARGFVVLAPDVFTARFIEKFPIEHDYAVEGDVSRGVEVLLALPDVGTDKACLASHTRGGYMTLKAATTHGHQGRDVVCYVSWYPHWQDPNAPEPMQVYRYAPEVDDLSIPVLVFIGDQEQYQRRRSIETGIRALQEKGRPARLVVYPGVGRGFDFRPPAVRTFADDLAAKDAVLRAAAFLREHLAPHAKGP